VRSTDLSNLNWPDYPINSIITANASLTRFPLLGIDRVQELCRTPS
jgi:hypothetical protein